MIENGVLMKTAGKKKAVSRSSAERAASRPTDGSKGEGISHPTEDQWNWLRRGLNQPGGKLPLFDEQGQRIHPQIVRSCIDNGWAVQWFQNPLKPDWLVCRLTDLGRALVKAD